MRKIFLIAFLLTSVAAFSQTAQFGDWYFRQRIGVNKPTNNLHPNSVFEVNDSSTSSLFRIYKNGAIQSFKFKNNTAEDSILTTDQFGNFKLRLKPSTVLPWDSITGKPSLLISGNNLADVSNVATARTNLSVYSIATVNDSLLNHFTKSQADARFKSIDWFPSVANVTGLPDSLTNLQARIQTKLTKTDADTYYPAIQRMQDSLAAVQARVQTKEPFISSGTTSQYWRGDKAWQTLDKSAVGLSAVPNVDATNPVNISQSATYRFVTDSEKSTWNAKQNALGYTAENAANKATDFSTVNNTLYPTVQAVSNAISSATSSYIPLSQKGANNGVATLDVGGKVPFSQLPAALMIYKGTWNVSTNTPTLSDGTGVAGWVYIVSVGGTVNTGSGNITYSAGDYAIHNGSTWEKSAGTNNVASVNGQQGVVNLTTANISESGNLYYTDARARAALSFTPGSGAYNSSTGVITIPTNTNQLTNGAGFITGYTETDPTIYAWAKAATKPSYSYGEITGTPTTWAWGSITGIPSTFAPSAHSHGNADITDLAWAKITGAPAFITGINSGMVTTALGYTPYNSTNPSGYITSSSLSGYLPLTAGIGQSLTGDLYLSGSSGASRYLILNESAAYTGNFILQAGAGSGGFGGGLVLNGHSRATKAGWVSVGISSGSSGKFAVNNSGLADGSDVFTVGADGIVTATAAINGTLANFSGTGTFNGTQISADGNGGYIQKYSSITGFYDPMYIYGGSGGASAKYLKLNNTVLETNVAINGTSLSMSGDGRFGTSTALTGIAGGIVTNSATSSGMTMRVSDVNKGFIYVSGSDVAVEGAASMNVKLLTGSGFFYNISPAGVASSNATTTLLAGAIADGTNKLIVNGAMKALGDLGLGVSGLTGGGNAKWITTDGVSGSTYGGGLISSINGTAKGYVYSDAGFMRVQGATGEGVRLVTNNSTVALDIASSGAITAISSVMASSFAASGTVTSNSYTATGVSNGQGIVTVQDQDGRQAQFKSQTPLGGTASIGSTTNHDFRVNTGDVGNTLHLGRKDGTNWLSFASTGAATFISTISNKDWISINSSAYPSSFPTSIGSNSSAIGYVQLGNNGQNYIVAGTQSGGGYLDIYVNNTSTLPTAPNGTLAQRISSTGVTTFYNSVTAVGFISNHVSGLQFNAFTGGSNWQIGSDAITGSGMYVYNSGGVYALNITTAGAVTAASSVTATSLIKSGSSDSYFLLGGGGHVLASTYATAASLSGYVDQSTNQYEIGGNKSFLGNVEVLSIKTTGGPGTPGVIKFGTKTNDTVFTGGSAYSIPVNIDGTTYYIRLWAGIN